MPYRIPMAPQQPSTPDTPHTSLGMKLFQAGCLLSLLPYLVMGLLFFFLFCVGLFVLFFG